VKQVSLADIRQTYITRDNLAEKTKSYLKIIESYNCRDVSLELENAALLVIDMQRCFLEPAFPLYTENARAIIPPIQFLLDHFRNKGRPVIFAAQKNWGEFADRGPVLRFWWPRTPLEGGPETEIIDELKPLPAEKVIAKRRYSAFYATDLDLTLRSMEVRQVVVTGLFTNVCVEATVRDAFMRDFLPFIPADACASLNEDLHIGSLRTLALWFAKISTAAGLVGG
jgi:nicotinamidase-related amidase